MSKVYTPATAAVGVEEVLRLLEGRWKLIILFHLFGGKVQRYSDFEKLIPGSEAVAVPAATAGDSSAFRQVQGRVLLTPTHGNNGVTLSVPASSGNPFCG